MVMWGGECGRDDVGGLRGGDGRGDERGDTYGGEEEEVDKLNLGIDVAREEL